MDKNPPFGGGGSLASPAPALGGSAGDVYRLGALWPEGGGGGGPALCRAFSRLRKSADCFDSAIVAGGEPGGGVRVLKGTKPIQRPRSDAKSINRINRKSHFFRRLTHSLNGCK